jgi:hypothetical protein
MQASAQCPTFKAEKFRNKTINGFCHYSTALCGKVGKMIATFSRKEVL